MPEPDLPDDVTGEELPRSVRRELSSFPPDTARRLARHLVAAGQLVVEDPDTAYAHAAYVKSRAPRLASVREAAGLAGYAAGHYADAMTDLRAARRMAGSPALLPVIADVERALGRPERALEIAASEDARALDAEGAIEMRIVAAGARRDLGQLEAAVLTLQVPDVRRSPRLAYAYADALLAVGRREDALSAFRSAAELDRSGETDADERVAELEGLVFVDLEDEDDAFDGVDAPHNGTDPGTPRDQQETTAPQPVAHRPAAETQSDDLTSAPSEAPMPLFLPPAAG